MLTMMLITTLSTADASPTNGFRLGLCVGASSNCHLGQLRLGYNLNRVGFTLGAGLLANLSVTTNVYLSSNESKTRQFISASWAMVGAPLIAIQFDGTIGGGFGAGYGLSYGADFHFLEKKNFILTPRVGIDWSSWLEGEAIHPSVAAEMTWAF